MARKKKVVEELSDDFNFEDDVEIDPHNLDAEIMSQPRFVSRYTSLAATANKNAKLAQEKLKTLRSVLIKEAQETLPKPTAMLVEAHYRVDEDYQEVKQEMIDAEFEADMINGCVSAIHAKRYSLIEAVRLISMDYFSAPSMPHDVDGVVDKMNDISRSDVADRMRKALNP